MSAATGTDAAGDERDLVHPALLYSDVDSYLSATISFVRAGLRQGEPVLVAVPTPKLDLLRVELSGVADRVRFLDMAVAGSNPNRIIPWILRAFVDEHAGRPVRVIVEPIWPGRPAAEVALGVQHEALVNSAFAGRPATFLCPYDAAGLDPAILGYAARTHPVIDRDGQRRRSGAYTAPDLIVAALNQPLAEPPGPVEELVFDATGLRGVRLLLAEYGERAGLPADRIGHFQVAVNEIATNTLVHGGSPGTVRVWQQRDRLLCEVRGPGHITDWLAGRIPPDGDRGCGRGLLVANRLCDLVQTYTGAGGTVTRLHMMLTATTR